MGATELTGESSCPTGRPGIILAGRSSAGDDDRAARPEHVRPPVDLEEDVGEAVAGEPVLHGPQERGQVELLGVQEHTDDVGVLLDPDPREALLRDPREQELGGAPAPELEGDDLVQTRGVVHAARIAANRPLRPDAKESIPTGYRLRRERSSLAAKSVATTVTTTLTAFRPRSFDSPPARGAMFTGTSSSRRPASVIRISASTSGASVVNGSASSGSAAAFTA